MLRGNREQVASKIGWMKHKQACRMIDAAVSSSKYRFVDLDVDYSPALKTGSVDYFYVAPPQSTSTPQSYINYLGEALADSPDAVEAMAKLHHTYLADEAIREI